MIDFSVDSRNNKVLPIISIQKMNKLEYMYFLCFYEVERYHNASLSLCFESITSVNYSKILQNEKLERITERLIENKNQYDETELAYLLLRHLFNDSWRLDFLFLSHLEQCMQANINWGTYLRAIAREKGILNGQPYWLRNVQINLLYDVDPELNNVLAKTELVMVKSKMVFPKYSSLGKDQYKHYFIHI